MKRPTTSPGALGRVPKSPSHQPPSRPRGRAYALRPDGSSPAPTGSVLLRASRALPHAPGRHRRLAAPRQLLGIAAAAAALRIAHGTSGRRHLEPPQRVVGAPPIGLRLHDPRESGDVRGIVGIVVLRRRPPMALIYRSLEVSKKSTAPSFN